MEKTPVQVRTVAQQPVAMVLVEAALRGDAKGSRPDAGAEAGISDRSRQRSDAAGKPLAGLEPVADGALVAVVELHDIDGNLLASRREPFQVAEQTLLRDPVEELVPAAPAGLEGTPRARPRRFAELIGVVFEKPVRVVTQRHPDPLHGTNLSGSDGNLEANLYLHPYPVRVGLQVDESGSDTSLQHAGQARSGGRRPPDHRDQLRLVPSGAIRRWRANAVVDATQPGTGGKPRLARGVQGPRPGERPGLPAVAQEAKGSRLDLRPAEPQHHRLQVERSSGEVANQ